MNNDIYYKGDLAFLYIKFFDKNNNEAKEVKNAKVRILHTRNEQIYEDLPWSQMQKLSESEYFFNYPIPYDCECGMYDIIYYGEINGDTASTLKSFNVIDKSQQFDNAIKLYGYINNFDNIPLSNVDIQIRQTDDSNVFVQSYSKENGYWEAYVYPGEYNFIFSKKGFNDYDISAQIGAENTEMQFNTITLESIVQRKNGSGSCKVSDSFILKNGIPLDELKITAANITNPLEVIATDFTNKDGIWTLYLDPGYYLLKIVGESMDKNFNESYKLTIDDDLNFNINDMNNNAIAEEESVGTGTGNKKYSDKILDKYENPIIDVQVNILQKDKLIAQAYTDLNGEYEFHLDPGKYTVNIYHPSFNTINDFEINL